MTNAIDPGQNGDPGQAGDFEQVWIKALRAACDAASQPVVAKRVGYSPAVVNQVLKGTYRGNMAKVEAAVRGALMGEKVRCPVVGDLARDVCLSNQSRTFEGTSAMRAEFYHTCRGGCPHYLGGNSSD